MQLSRNDLYEIKNQLKEIKHEKVQKPGADGEEVKEICKRLDQLDIVLDYYLAFADEHKG